MQTSDGVGATALEFLGYIWADLLIFAVSAAFCVLSAMAFPKSPRPRAPAQKHKKIASGTPLVRIHKVVEHALVCLGVRQLPLEPAPATTPSTRQESQVASAPLPEFQYGTRLKACYGNGDLAGVQQVLTEMAAAGHQPKEISYNALINAAVSAGEFQIAWDAVGRMKKDGVAIGVFTVSIMMKTLRQRDSRRPLHHRHHTRVFEFLDDSGVDCCSDAVLLTTVVDACVWHKEHYRIVDIVEAYLRSNLKPAVPVYGSLIKATKCVRRLDLAWALWREVVEVRELTPSPIVLGCMLDALVCGKHVDDATIMYDEWRAKMPLTTVIYSTLAKGFLNSGQAERAMQILVEMRTDGVARSTVLYNMIIGVHAARGTMDEVRELMRAMSLDGCEPDIITYSSVVKGNCMKGDLEVALRGLREAQQRGIILDTIIYSSMFYGCYRHNRSDLTDQLVTEMSSSGLVPSSFTLSIIVQMYGNQGRLDRAFDVVKLMSHSSSNGDSRVATALLNACVRNGDADRAERIFHSLAHGAEPDARSFWPLVDCCLRSGGCQRALALVEAWYTPRSTDPSKSAYKDRLVGWLQGALEADKQSEALALVEKLRAAAQNASAGQNASSKKDEYWQ